MGSKKLGMWLFIVSDTLTFSVLLITYSYSRLTNPDWPRPFPINPAIIFSTTMTVVLLASSLTMVMAVMAAQRNDRKKTVLWMVATMIGGLLLDRKSTRLNSSHLGISYAVFCLKKKNKASASDKAF